MDRKKIVYPGITILVAAGILYGWLFGSVKKVDTVQAVKGSIVKEITETGYVQPVDSKDLYAAQNSTVKKLFVEAGQKVEKGQILVVLENIDLIIQIRDVRSSLSQTLIGAEGSKAALDKASAELEDAKENYARIQNLYETGAASRMEYDKAALQVQIDEKNLQEASTVLQAGLAQAEGLKQSLAALSAKEEQLTVKSPLEGIVLAVPVKLGQVVNPGVLLVTVADSDQLEVKADILSDDLGQVAVGQKVTITAEVLDRQLAGEVKKIYPQAEEKVSALGVIQRRVPVLVTFKDPANLKPGYEVKVAIETLSRTNVLIAPRESVITRGDGQKEVAVVNNGRINYQLIETGINDQENIEVAGGIKEGDILVRDGSLGLKERTKVKIQQ
ncbi:MAG: Efflux transporter, RND family, MFP subunit [Desulfotomaculum sp. 46_296]|nr:MAG: Efflux transporter, RND family, MFP subunit [Desulfotomaculum sp. 46_296]